MITAAYPGSPLHVDASKLQPSPSFKKQVGTVIFSILLFFLVYFLLIVLSLLLVAACFVGCVAIISASPGFLTLVLGVGLLVLGIAVFIFLIKFIFAKSEEGNPLKMEVKKHQEPALFDFIEKLTRETKTPFPKKIFISPDVNASVFYNSSFWSMFFPVKKNLEIGTGLINSVNASEFKAILAHEFGHFSQRSMKLGSFTYNVNKVIYNMLYNNNSYNNFLSKWSNISGYFAIFAGITAGIANGIRSILGQMYKFINKNYMGLSREMEFHADAVAASVAGSNNLISSLNRLELAASCYDTALNHADNWLKEKKFSPNLFSYQLHMVKSIAQDHKLELINGIPEVSSKFLETESRARVNFKNQWASHPTLEERTQHLQSLGMQSETDRQSAWIFFKDPQALQQQMTSLLYSPVNKEGTQEMPGDFFITKYEQEKQEDKLPEVYKGFYNGRIQSVESWNLNDLAAKTANSHFDEIFTDENGGLWETIHYLQADINVLTAIKNKQIDVKSFDFDGEKISVTEVDKVLDQLDKEKDTATEKMKLLSMEAFSFFHNQNPTDKRLYLKYYGFQKDEQTVESFTKLGNEIIEDFRPFYQENVSIDFVERTLYSFKERNEKSLKTAIERIILDKLIDEERNKGLIEKLNSFKEKDYAYFTANGFINEELAELNQVLFETSDALQQFRWKQYKDLLNLQLEYYQPASR